MFIHIATNTQVRRRKKTKSVRNKKKQMSAASNQPKGKPKQPMNQQTNTSAGPARSTIPKSAQSRNAPPQRNGRGSNDAIYTNHFACSFAPKITFYQYDAVAEEYHEKQKRFIEIPSRGKRYQFVSDLLLDKVVHPTAVCWYDEGNCIYSTTNFEDLLPSEHIKTNEKGYQHRLTIKSRTGTSGTDNLDQSTVRIIETLIKQVLKKQFKAIGSVFYRWDGETSPEGPYDLLMGFKQALCLTQSGPTLNVDTTVTRFYPHSDLLPFIWERLLSQRESDFRGQLTDRQYDQIGDRLKGVEVTTAQSDHQKKYILTGLFSFDLPEKIPIEKFKHLLEYYKSIGHELKNPKLYCLKAHKPNTPDNIVDLPIEICSLVEWQQVTEDENMKAVQAPPVATRYHSIMEAVRNCNFHDDELCQEIQLHVNCTEMMRVPYGILSKRQIIQSRGGGFTEPVSIGNMAFIYLADHQLQYAREVQNKLLDNFYDAAKRHRMRLPDAPEECEIYADSNLETKLRDHLSYLKENQCQFVLCLENCRDPTIHELFKQIASVELGLVTQCANFGTINNRKTNIRSYCDNFLQSVNGKLSGVNKEVAQLKTRTKIMFVGADVQHVKNNYSGELPSIAAVIASMNSECTITNKRISRQWPSVGKQSEEAILLLREMISQLLIAFREKNNGSLPEHVVFYRDGVDDGQFERLLKEEVTDVRNAFKAVYPPNSSPPLTFIVVKKRHHTRLFDISAPESVNNVESGVVVDRAIVHLNPNYLNFFLNSHRPGLGTNKIGNYVVLVNDTNCSLNELEDLTFSLCHTDQRIDSRLSESIPSVVHLADAAASKARQRFDNRSRPPNGIPAEILVLHEDVQDEPNMF